MEKKGTKDLTVGNPMKVILGFMIPVFFGILFQSFYNLMDSVIVGQTLGKDALAAVGATGPITFLIIGFCNGTASGFSIPVAQRFGAKDEKGVQKFISNGIKLSIAVSVVITAIVCILCMPILEMMKTPDNIIQDSYLYLMIIFIGIPFTIFYNLFAGIIRAMGDSKTPVIMLIISSVLNIALDIFFIVVLQTGVEGAAYATVISQAVSVSGCAYVIIKRYNLFGFDAECKKVDTHCMKNLLGMGMPMGLQYSVTAIGSVILQTAVNSLGSDYVASITAGCKIGMFVCAMFEALGITMSTFGGQNLGARRLERISRGMRDGIIIGFAYSILACIFLNIFSEKLILLFIDGKEVEIIKNAALYLKIESYFYVLLTLVNGIRFMIQGLGYSSLAVIAGVMEMIARAIIGFWIIPVMGYTAACLASPLAWLLADIFLVPAFFIITKKLKRRFAI